MNNTYSQIEIIFRGAGIIPVIQLKDYKKAGSLAKALAAGKMSVAEVTFREDRAEKVIERIKGEHSKLTVGAGTVLTMDQANRAIDAGADFVVSPGFNPEIVESCLKKEVPVFPGCVTPTEIERAICYGLHVLKFFPAKQFGGIPAIKALSGPYPQVRFLPTGGITLENLEEYLSCKQVVACGGSFMAKPEMLEKEDWEQITKQCSKADSIVKRIRG